MDLGNILEDGAESEDWTSGQDATRVGTLGRDNGRILTKKGWWDQQSLTMADAWADKGHLRIKEGSGAIDSVHDWSIEGKGSCIIDGEFISGAIQIGNLQTEKGRWWHVYGDVCVITDIGKGMEGPWEDKVALFGNQVSFPTIAVDLWVLTRGEAEAQHREGDEQDAINHGKAMI